MKYLRVMTILFSIIVSNSILFGDIVYLKDGRKFEDVIAEETENGVEWKFFSGTAVGMPKNYIEKIEYTTVSDAEKIIVECEGLQKEAALAVEKKDYIDALAKYKEVIFKYKMIRQNLGGLHEKANNLITECEKKIEFIQMLTEKEKQLELSAEGSGVWIGVIIQPVSQDIVEAFKLPDRKGALVSDIILDSPAKKAGMKKGDVIREVDGKSVDTYDNLSKIVHSLEIGKEVLIKVIRRGEGDISLKVKIGEMPEEGETEMGAKEKTDLGLVVQDISPDIARRLRLSTTEGVIVAEVEPGSSADRAGLQPKDVITEVNNQTVKNIADYNKAMASLKEGENVVLLLRRGEYSIFQVIKPKKIEPIQKTLAEKKKQLEQSAEIDAQRMAEQKQLEAKQKAEEKRRQEEEKYSPKTQEQAINEWKKFRTNEQVYKGTVTTWSFKCRFIFSECPYGYLDPVEQHGSNECKVWVEGPGGWPYQSASVLGKVPVVKVNDWIIVTGKFKYVSSDGDVVLEAVRVKNEGYK